MSYFQFMRIVTSCSNTLLLIMQMTAAAAAKVSLHVIDCFQWKFPLEQSERCVRWSFQFEINRCLQFSAHYSLELKDIRERTFAQLSVHCRNTNIVNELLICVVECAASLEQRQSLLLRSRQRRGRRVEGGGAPTGQL